MLRQTLIESLLLALTGGIGGVLLAAWGVKAIPIISSAKIPRIETVAIDSRVLLFAFAVSVLTAIIFGLVPALQFWRNDIQSVLKEGGRSGPSGPVRHGLRNSLVISEIAIALVLLTGAGLLVRSFVSLLRVDPGFSRENVVALQVFLSRQFQPEQTVQFFDQALEKIQTVPGVKSASVVASPPFINLEQDAPFTIVGQPAPPAGSEPTAYYSEVSSDYLSTLSIPLRTGRFFTKHDRGDSPQVVVINDTMARRYFRDEDPIGKKLSVSFEEATTREIIGVIGDVLHNGLDSESRPEMFVPYTQSPSSQMTFVVKTTADAAAMLSQIKSAVREVNRNQTFAKTATMEELVSDSLKQRRFHLFLLGLFAVLALTLAAIGIYGSISYSARQRTNEIGVRLALGAQSSDVIRLIVGQGLTLALIGVAIGLVVSFALTRVIKGLLFGVSATDPLTFIAIAALLTFTALVASWIPAWRATKVDPLEALRYE